MRFKIVSYNLKNIQDHELTCFTANLAEALKIVDFISRFEGDYFILDTETEKVIYETI